MKIIVCDKCFTIPKIRIINRNEIKVECPNCRKIMPHGFNYFNKFINGNNNDDLFILPQCNFNRNHSRAILYCFKCNKYLCQECSNIHNEAFQGKGHITISQRISHQYYCKKQGHEENILNRFCLKCEDYLCCDCRCSHSDEDKYYFNDDESKINEVKNNILKCQNTIEKEEIYFNNFIEQIQNLINTLSTLFNDYKKRNTDLISFYKLLIDNYEQLKNIKNYNIRNNILINNNFDFRNSETFSDECLNSNFNRMSEFYRNINHIKPKEFANYYLTSKFCYSKIKKCLILNEKIILFMFEKESEEHICFVYKTNNNEYRLTRMFYDDFIKDIYPLNDNKYIYIKKSNDISISDVELKDNSLESSTLLSFKNIKFIILDIFNKDNFFAIENSEKGKFFILKYYIKDGNKNTNKNYENSLENKNNMYLILKENKKFNNTLFEDITKMIEDSKINYQEKADLNLIFKCDDENHENIQRLINLNDKFLNFIKIKNENICNTIKEKISNNENKYVINSNYIMKLIAGLNKNYLNQKEKKEIDYICIVNKLCKEIMEKYIHYLVFNSKINNIYNYNNKYLLFMGEHYLLIVYSLLEKKFLGLETANLIPNSSNNFNNFEIIQITSDKILINNKEDKIIYIIENNISYNFCLIKTTFSYYANAQTNTKYLLFDKLTNNKLLFVLINLNDYSNEYNYHFNNLLNFKINNNPPKIILNKDFSKFIYLFKDSNQLGVVDFTLNKQFGEDNQNSQNIRIILKSDNDSEIHPKIHDYSSFYSEDYKPNKLFEEKEYYCSKAKANEFITFKFDKEYSFCKISITFPDRYKKARLKQYKISVYDLNGNFLEDNNFTNYSNEYETIFIHLDFKGAYLKFEFLSNFGEDYFCIQKIQFYADITHTVSIQ